MGWASSSSLRSSKPSQVPADESLTTEAGPRSSAAPAVSWIFWSPPARKIAWRSRRRPCGGSRILDFSETSQKVSRKTRQPRTPDCQRQGRRSGWDKADTGAMHIARRRFYRTATYGWLTASRAGCRRSAASARPRLGTGCRIRPPVYSQHGPPSQQGPRSGNQACLSPAVAAAATGSGAGTAWQALAQCPEGCPPGRHRSSSVRPRRRRTAARPRGPAGRAGWAGRQAPPACGGGAFSPRHPRPERKSRNLTTA